MCIFLCSIERQSLFEKLTLILALNPPFCQTAVFCTPLSVVANLVC
jgi:hypothetical protein